ncbi:hypothetical protein TWF102_010185 [Orbilia oligospora]|uniref:Uncharacterized protein n=1 Tax=Orbilia oligospora TaxID=2813651 RepID=A0A7C8J4B3_ORBOL|nr:hypothetical protein TWF102_010185 [Orbilia oligospora]KAF3094302.1 hypothetical protein TWF706_008526 [Orbilia oligospora]
MLDPDYDYAQSITTGNGKSNRDKLSPPLVELIDWGYFSSKNNLAFPLDSVHDAYIRPAIARQLYVITNRGRTIVSPSKPAKPQMFKREE